MTEPIKWVYTKKVKEHFTNPKNILEDESSYDEDGRGLVGNVQCGDQMLMVIKVDSKSKIITDCKWKTYGCASAIASTSILSEHVKGMSLEDAYKLTPKDIVKDLGGLPEHKIHCSVLGDKALRAAINDYHKRSGTQGVTAREDSRVICKCMNVTNHEIENAVKEGADTYRKLQEQTKIGTVCGQCEEDATRLLEEYKQKYFK
ncbi:MAG: iron-sulfur cluster assembly scaffold protein [Candidatus Orphnella occulta]|nr:iron-sulfur cluster assembly scaffold protein [Candidatus Orphnella occulta]